MSDVSLIGQTSSAAEFVEVPVTGRLLLGQPLLNKGTAFDARERRELGLPIKKGRDAIPTYRGVIS